MQRDRDVKEALCPRCGEDAEWSFADVQKSRVEVNCPDCGRFAMAREEFDDAQADMPELDAEFPLR